MVIFSLFGFFTFDLVYLFSVLNYAAQAEMNVYLIWDIARLIKENKYEHVDAAIKVSVCVCVCGGWCVWAWCVVCVCDNYLLVIIETT